jgi:hypothetical protein
VYQVFLSPFGGGRGRTGDLLKIISNNLKILPLPLQKGHGAKLNYSNIGSGINYSKEIINSKLLIRN